MAGRLHRLRVGRRLVGTDGEPMWATFAASVIRDAVGAPRQLITIVDDDTEVSLLQRRLSHQALHDVLTGLPNRQFFSTRLENLLRDADAARGVTLFHLDLDGFSQITGGLGQDLGDRVLRGVAAKLKAVFEGEKALVARLGGDEFGVLVQNTADTPGVVTLVRRITHELAEPDYVDGDRGVAVSASIGVVHRPPRDITPAELLRASDLTLRRVQRTGAQWGLFDRELDRRDRHDFGLAAAMAGAWENGEVEVGYRALVAAADGSVAGRRGAAALEPPDRRRAVARDVRAAGGGDGAGVAAGHVASAHGGRAGRGGRHRRAADRRADGAPGRRPRAGRRDPRRPEIDRPGARHLRPGFPSATLLADSGDAADNLKVLAEIGVGAEIHDFADVTCLTDFPARAVCVAANLVARRDHPLVDRSLTALIEAAHLAGAEVAVTGIERADESDWWRDRGADRLSGPLFTEVPGGLPAC